MSRQAKAQDQINYLFDSVNTKAQRTQLKIIEAAISLFVSHGFYETTYSQIAKTSKVSRPLVLHYFPTRDHLFEFAMKFIRANLQKMAIEKLSKGTTAKEMLKLYVESTFDWIIDYRSHAVLWLLFYYFSAIRPDMRKLNSDLVRMGEERIQGILMKGIEEGELKLDKSKVKKQAKDIQNLITISLVTSLTENQTPKPQIFCQDVSRECLQRAGYCG